MLNLKNNIFIHVVIPMLVGGVIYILFREQNILMFRWFDFLGFDYLTTHSKEAFYNNNMLPFWVKYSLPDGIWVYSMTSLMLIIWHNNTSSFKYIWILIGPFFGLFLELGQLVNIISGTYDHIDLLFTIFFSIIPFLIFKLKLNRRPL